MTITRTPITSREDWLALRAGNIGASEISALFGANQFKTHLQLWAEKSGQIPAEGPSSQIMERGLIFEPAVAKAVSVLRPDWKLTQNTEYFASAQWRLGATPDYLAYCPKRGSVGVLQTKFIALPQYEEKWQDGPPLGYVLQTAQEVLLYGEAHPDNATWGAIGVIVFSTYGYDKAVWEFDRNSGAEARIIRAATSFWEAVARGEAPKADFSRDGETIKAMHPTDDGSTVDMTGDNLLASLLAERAELTEIIRAAGLAVDADVKRVDAINAEIKLKIGAASVVICDGWELSHKVQTRKAMPETSFRVLRAKRIKQKDMAA